MNPITFFELLLLPEFQAGLGWGLVGLVALLVATRDRDVPLPFWGVTVAAASLVATQAVIGRRLALAVGVTTLFIGGELIRKQPIAGVPVVLAGAIVIAVRSGLEPIWWIQLGTILFVLVGGWAIHRVDTEFGESGMPTLMLAGTVFGVWATVPETELARVLMGAVTATLITGWPMRRTRIGSGGAYAVAGLIAWVIGIGGEPRLGSILGGWATIGAFSVAVFPHSSFDRRPGVLIALHTAAVLVASRIAGLSESPYLATAIAAPTILVVMLIWWLVAHRPDATSGALGDQEPEP